MKPTSQAWVVVSFLFAVVLGGFWGYESIRHHLRRSQNEALVEVANLRAKNQQLQHENTEVEAKLKTAQENSTKDAKKAKADILKLEAMYANAADLVKPLEIKYLLAIEETKKVIEENKALARALAKREQDLDKIAAENNDLFAKLQAADNERKGKPMITDPNKPKPPVGFLKGNIEEVHATDKSLVQVSFGSDVGLNVDHTLEVYRLKPKAEYLGMIRIIETTPHRAVGRLVRTNMGLPVPELRVGDEVASRIQPR